MTPARSGRLSESLAELEAALAQLWEPDTAGTGKARAYTVNLVAVGGDPRFAEIVHDVAMRLAARTFIITVDPRLEPWSLDGEVSAVCQPGERQLCAERIELRFGAVAAKRARSVIEALSESRLRTVMLVGPGAHGDVVDGLAPECARVVVDSAVSGVARSAHIAALTEGDLGDLAFVRGRRWREMIARLFDVPERRAALATIHAIELEYVAAPDHASSAAAEPDLLLGWLGSRLGWRAAPGVVHSGRGERIDVRIAAVERADVLPGCLDTVVIHAGDADARIERERDAQHLCCTLRTPAGTSTSRHFYIPHREPAEEVARALGDSRGEALVRPALAFAAAYRGLD